VARDATTEPGIGTSAENMALKRENMRLRRERNEARQALSQALTQSAPGIADVPPVRFGKLKLMGKWAILGTVVGLLAPVIERYVPEYAAVIHELVKAFGS
jgi:hypothetical protein